MRMQAPRRKLQLRRRQQKSVTIQSAFANASALTADRDTMLDVALAQAIVSSNLTFRSLDNRFLRAFIRLLNSSYQLSHRTLARKLSDKLYFALMHEIKKKVMAAESVSVTTDAATMSTTGYPYICVTAHFVHDGQLIDVILALAPAPGSHTAVSIEELLVQVLAEWKLSHLACITTDNGSNFVAAVNLLTRERESTCTVDEGFRCACHTLQLVVGDVLDFKVIPSKPQPDASDPEFYVQKVHALCVWLRGSNGRPEALKKFQVALVKSLKNQNRTNEATRLQQTELNTAEEIDAQIQQAEDEKSQARVEDDESHHIVVSKAWKLILKNATRWSSTYLMLVRFLLLVVAADQKFGLFGQASFEID